MTGPHIDRDLISNRTKCYIFDIDGILADVHSILMLYKDSYNKKLEEYQIQKAEYEKKLKEYESKVERYQKGLTTIHPMGAPKEPIAPVKHDPSLDNKIDFEYFHDHLTEAAPIMGCFDLFISLAKTSKVFLLTGRSEKGKAKTIEWINKVVTSFYSDDAFRRINFQLIMRSEKEYKLTGPQYKKAHVLEISKNYNIKLILEDCPEIVQMYTELGFLVLQPNKEYYRLGQE